MHASWGTAVLNGLADHESGVVNYREEVALVSIAYTILNICEIGYISVST